MSRKQIILGIDPGLADTGWGIITKEKGSLQLVGYGDIKTAANDNLPHRLTVLHQELQEIIEEFSPEIVAVEQLFFGKNVKTAMKVGEARGIVMYTIGKNNMQYTEFTPNAIKTALTGYGGATKMQIQEMVKTLLKLDHIPRPNHAADALAAAITASVTLTSYTTTK